MKEFMQLLSLGALIVCLLSAASMFGQIAAFVSQLSAVDALRAAFHHG